MTRWEYHAHTTHSEKLNGFLNSVGPQGWELVQLYQPAGFPSGVVTCILRRPLAAGVRVRPASAPAVSGGTET